MKIIKYTDSSFFKKIYGTGGFPKINNLEGRLKYFMYRLMTPNGNGFYFSAELDNEIIGLAHVGKNPYKKDTYWISYLSVDSNHQSKGIASLISTAIFKWAGREKIELQSSMYSNMGWQKLKPLWNKLSKKYNVNFVDSNDRM